MVLERFTTSPRKSACIELYCNLYSTCDVKLNLVLTYNIELSLVKECIHCLADTVYEADWDTIADQGRAIPEYLLNSHCGF